MAKTDELMRRLLGDRLREVVSDVTRVSGLPRFMVMRALGDEVRVMLSADGLRQTIAPARDAGG